MSRLTLTKCIENIQFLFIQMIKSECCFAKLLVFKGITCQRCLFDIIDRFVTSGWDEKKGNAWGEPIINVPTILATKRNDCFIALSREIHVYRQFHNRLKLTWEILNGTSTVKSKSFPDKRVVIMKLAAILFRSGGGRAQRDRALLDEYLTKAEVSANDRRSPLYYSRCIHTSCVCVCVCVCVYVCVYVCSVRIHLE